MSGIGIFLCSGEVIVRYPILHPCNKGGRVTKSDKFCIGDWGDEAIYRRTDDIPLNADAVAGGESVLFGSKKSLNLLLGEIVIYFEPSASDMLPLLAYVCPLIVDIIVRRHR